jgi:cell division protein FtsQ
MIGLAVLGAVGGTAWAGYRFVTTSSRFAITAIEIRGNQQLSADDIRAALPARVGDNVFATDLDEVLRELRSNPWIATAEARRELPSTIVIAVREHVPAAVVQLGGLYLVDAEGHVFKRAAADDGAGLPIITGLDRAAYVANPASTATQVRDALAALATWRSSTERPSIGEVHVDTHGGLTLVTYEQAISIQLGTLDVDLVQRMRTFDATWAELTDDERGRARAIHLDARPDQVTVALTRDPKKDP